ncbi:OLC1v1023755C1 [Oldenlandia corymbosa var. corymbosa]|uniref:OLC1v1023755C1 n=1 Tax=Oldenlandia corymbosa var. corymbosa TaxID=529605 RepID=A0AAV1C4A8_OLDCO|nr:OLC1v1023755C1 [Oldenlandia corymbosa var. corymbosa]
MQSCSDCSCYIGEFKNGVKHGIGVYHFRNEDWYAGEYLGDKIHGFGVYHFANGHCYEGSWHEGMVTKNVGNGMVAIKAALPPSSDVVLRAVHGARKTAEKSIHIRTIDEQVNKAVMAANKDATAARVAAVKAVQNRIDGKFCETPF